MRCCTWSSYPFECSEQLASRILAVAALRDVLTAFEAEGLPSPEEMEAAVKRDIERLRGLQNYDGGFPYWRAALNRSPSTPSTSPTPCPGPAKGFAVPAARC
jgi:alpha-2-macroglobulin